MTTVETPGADDADLDEFTARNAWAMRSRLAHGAAKFGALSWREESYSDGDNLARLDRAVGHLSAALGQYRLGTVDEDEVQKRAADVANQAFMLADPARPGMTSERAVEARTWNETRNGYDVTGPCYACGSPIAYFVDEDGTPRDIRAAPREDGWEELRREIEALPEANDGTAGEWSLVERRAVLAIVDRLAAARGEPPEPGPAPLPQGHPDTWPGGTMHMAKPEPGPAIDVERLRNAMTRVCWPTLDSGDLAIAVPVIAAEYDRLRP